MATSSDNLATEKLGLLSHPEESMDFEYEDLEVCEAWTKKLTLHCPVSYLYNYSTFLIHL